MSKRTQLAVLFLAGVALVGWFMYPGDSGRSGRLSETGESPLVIETVEPEPETSDSLGSAPVENPEPEPAPVANDSLTDEAAPVEAAESRRPASVDPGPVVRSASLPTGGPLPPGDRTAPRRPPARPSGPKVAGDDEYRARREHAAGMDAFLNGDAAASGELPFESDLLPDRQRDLFGNAFGERGRPTRAGVPRGRPAPRDFSGLEPKIDNGSPFGLYPVPNGGLVLSATPLTEEQIQALDPNSWNP